MGLISSLRDYAFSRGLLRSTRVNVTVISIGNLIAGGSGKTPVVAWMLDYLRQRHYEPAVIARGYGGATAGEANDEAAMLGSAVYCHPQRATAAATAIASGANCLIMDDGLQHRKKTPRHRSTLYRRHPSLGLAGAAPRHLSALRHFTRRLTGPAPLPWYYADAF